MDSIFDDEQLKRYSEIRLFGKNVSPEIVDKIKLYNAYLPSELEQILTCEKRTFVKVTQENEREPIYYDPDNKTLFLSQTSGFDRRERYEQMIKLYGSLPSTSPKLREYLSKGEFSLERKESHLRTAIAYENMAYDFVVGLFVPNNKYEDRRVFENKDISKIRKIIFGPVKTFAKKAEIIAVGKSEYLKSQILNVNGEEVLNIDYVYSDQARRLIYKMLLQFSGVAQKQQQPIHIDFFMNGRVGGLEDSLGLNDLVAPEGIIDSEKMLKREKQIILFDNTLAKSGLMRGLDLKVNNVLTETKEQLDMAYRLGCSCVEMEVYECIEAIETARRDFARGKYPVSASFGFLGYVSDLPRKGITLADESDPKIGESKSADEIINKVKENKRK
jgi:hypothetical protein